jgi:hypothetical protein
MALVFKTAPAAHRTMVPHRQSAVDLPPIDRSARHDEDVQDRMTTEVRARAQRSVPVLHDQATVSKMYPNLQTMKSRKHIQALDRDGYARDMCGHMSRNR